MCEGLARCSLSVKHLLDLLLLYWLRKHFDAWGKRVQLLHDKNSDFDYLWVYSATKDTDMIQLKFEKWTNDICREFMEESHMTGKHQILNLSGNQRNVDKNDSPGWHYLKNFDTMKWWGKRNSHIYTAGPNVNCNSHS